VVLISDSDFCFIKEMVSCLEPLKLAVAALCRRDTNLLSGEAALQFCLGELQKQNSELARTLADVLLVDFFFHQSLIVYLIPGRPGMRTAIPEFPGM